MHEVAESSTVTFPIFILPATGLTKVCHRRQFCIERATSIPTIVKRINGSLSLCFPFVPRINISDQVVAYIVAYVQLEQVPIFCKFAVQVFIYSIKIVLELLVGKVGVWIVSWIMVYVWEQDGLRKRRLDVFTRAAVAMPTRANFVIERAVDTVLLCPKD